MENPATVSLNEMARGFFRGKLLCAAVRIGIADALGDAEKSVEELALETRANPDALYRVLRALASIEVVAEVESSRFVLTPLGRPLRRDVPDTVWALIIFWSDLLADSWTYLADCAKANDRTTAGKIMEQQGVLSRWSREPDARAIFHAAFAESTPQSMSPFVSACDFSGDQLVADFGGGGGALLTAILLANPHVSGIFVDREQAAAGVKSKMQALNLENRCELVVADLLIDELPRADTVILQSVLHGYDDENARQLLQNCRKAINHGGRLLVIEVVLPNRIAATSPKLESMFMGDMNMLVATGGRERNEMEWSALLSSAGYQTGRITPVSGQIASIIEATLKA